MNRCYLKVCGLLLGVLLVSAPAITLAASPYFKGKTVRLLVGFRPGGGTDIQARFFASRWPAFIPGKPRIIVTNLPPNIAAKNYLWKVKPDGTTLLFVASGGVSIQYDKRARFKADQFNWIGAHASRDLLWLVRGNATDGSIENCPRKGSDQQLVLAVRDIESLTGKSLSAITLARWFRCSLKVLSVGRQGTADDLLMLERGEQNSWLAGSTWYALPSLRPGWIKEGYLKPFANMSHPDTPIKPNAEAEMKLPNVYEFLTSEQREVWKSFHLSEVYAGKGITTSPGTSPEILAILRKAYEDALATPEFTAGLERIMGQPVTFSRSSTLQKQTREYLKSFKPELQKRLQQEALDYIGYQK